MRGSINVLNTKASRQVLPTELSSELRVLLRWSTHRIDKARDIALGYLNRLITSLPSLMFSPSLVFAILEVLTLLRKACENEHYDEVRMLRIFEGHGPCHLTISLDLTYLVQSGVRISFGPGGYHIEARG